MNREVEWRIKAIQLRLEAMKLERQALRDPGLNKKFILNNIERYQEQCKEHMDWLKERDIEVKIINGKVVVKHD